MEAVAGLEGDGRLKLFGPCGDQFRETAEIALSLACGLSRRSEPSQIYLQLVSGDPGIVDGSSAGLALVLAFYSLLTGARPKAKWALSGAITLRGNVLPVNGCETKLLAAERFGVTDVVFAHGSLDSNGLTRLKTGARIHVVHSVREAIEMSLETPVGDIE